jgi:hypothetical protein
VPPEFGREVSQELIEFLLSVSQPEYAASRFDFINNMLLPTGPACSEKVAAKEESARSTLHKDKSIIPTRVLQNVNFASRNLCTGPT